MSNLLAKNKKDINLLATDFAPRGFIAPEKGSKQKISISPRKHMLWILFRSASLRHF